MDKILEEMMEYICDKRCRYPNEMNQEELDEICGQCAMNGYIGILENTSANQKRMPFIHEIKILPAYYDAVISGIKHFELRRDDRDYQIGDFVVLKEWVNGEYTGRETGFKIEYILRDCTEYGLMDGYCILGW